MLDRVYSICLHLNLASVPRSFLLRTWLLSHLEVETKSQGFMSHWGANGLDCHMHPSQISSHGPYWSLCRDPLFSSLCPPMFWWLHYSTALKTQTWWCHFSVMLDFSHLWKHVTQPSGESPPRQLPRGGSRGTPSFLRPTRTYIHPLCQMRKRNALEKQFSLSDKEAETHAMKHGKEGL